MCKLDDLSVRQHSHHSRHISLVGSRCIFAILWTFWLFLFRIWVISLYHVFLSQSNILTLAAFQSRQISLRAWYIPLYNITLYSVIVSYPIISCCIMLYLFYYILLYSFFIESNPFGIYRNILSFTVFYHFVLYQIISDLNYFKCHHVVVWLFTFSHEAVPQYVSVTVTFKCPNIRKRHWSVADAGIRLSHNDGMLKFIWYW